MDTFSMDALQSVRKNLNKPVIINSGHRCFLRNALVGGRPRSAHKRIAFDISLDNQDDLEKVLYYCSNFGFKGFGFYRTFLHVDMKSVRYWSTNGGREVWKDLILKNKNPTIA